jgi:hypothetical protein
MVVEEPVDPSELYEIRRVHVFEEDSPDGQVYKPGSGPIPLSRRPREALTLHANGTATVETGGPADKPIPHSARWRAAGQDIVVELDAPAAGSPAELHVTSESPDRLVVAPPRR